MVDPEPSASGKVAISIVSGCFAVVSALIPIVDGWRQRRDVSQRATRELELASKQVTFWKSIVDASDAEGEAKTAITSMVAANLLRIAAKQELELIAQLASYAPLAARSTSERIFLLYKPRSPAAWMPRFLMYATVIYLVYSVIHDGASAFGDPLVSAMFFTLIGLVLIFRYLAERLARPRRP